MSNELPCMNCKKPTSTESSKFFAEVFLCEGCHTQAVHFYARLERELVFLQTMAKESIRVTLIEGRFSFPEGPAGEPSKREVLEAILDMEEARPKPAQEQARWPATRASHTPTTRSTASTSPNARTLAALAKGSSPKGSQQG